MALSEDLIGDFRAKLTNGDLTDLNELLKMAQHNIEQLDKAKQGAGSGSLQVKLHQPQTTIRWQNERLHINCPPVD
jgi:hypothetical protein